MVDRTKPLKIEEGTNGTEIDMIPTEVDPSEDYLAAKGLALRNQDGFLIDDDGTEIQFTDPLNGTKKVSDFLDQESAVPVYSWGRSSNSSAGTWLQNENVLSNKSGRQVPFASTVITRLFSNTEDANTYTVTIYEHEGDEINLTSLTTLSVTADRNGDSGPINIAVTTGRQLAVQVTAGSARNIVVKARLNGENT